MKATAKSVCRKLRAEVEPGQETKFKVDAIIDKLDERIRSAVEAWYLELQE